MTASGRFESPAAFAGTPEGHVTTDQHPLEVPQREEAAESRGVRRNRPIAALAQMIETLLTPSPAASSDALNHAHRLGETAAAGMLGAGDLCGWELSTRISAELTALARTGWLSAEPVTSQDRGEVR